MMHTYEPRNRHTTSYYLTVIQGLLAGLKDGLNDKDMAASLNERGLLSATGKPWSVTAVVQALYKLRHGLDAGSYLHTAMLQLCFDGVLAKAQVLPLLEPRRGLSVRM